MSEVKNILKIEFGDRVGWRKKLPYIPGKTAEIDGIISSFLFSFCTRFCVDFFRVKKMLYKRRKGENENCVIHFLKKSEGKLVEKWGKNRKEKNKKNVFLFFVFVLRFFCFRFFLQIFFEKQKKNIN